MTWADAAQAAADYPVVRPGACGGGAAGDEPPAEEELAEPAGRPAGRPSWDEVERRAAGETRYREREGGCVGERERERESGRDAVS